MTNQFLKSIEWDEDGEFFRMFVHEGRTTSEYNIGVVDGKLIALCHQGKIGVYCPNPPVEVSDLHISMSVFFGLNILTDGTNGNYVELDKYAKESWIGSGVVVEFENATLTINYTEEAVEDLIIEDKYSKTKVGIVIPEEYHFDMSTIPQKEDKIDFDLESKDGKLLAHITINGKKYIKDVSKEFENNNAYDLWKLTK